jgi:cytochrome P450
VRDHLRSAVQARQHRFPRKQEKYAMTTVHPPVIEYPFLASPQPFEPAPLVLELSRQSELLRVALPGDITGWLVTGYEQVREVLIDPRFSRAQLNRPEQDRRGLEIITAASLLGLDPPEHTRVRKLVAGAFTARRMRELAPHVAAIATELVDAMVASQPPIDLVSAFSLPLPIRVICEMLGIPASDQSRFRGWSETLVGDWNRDQGEMTAAMEAICDYIAELIAAKRANPADDLLSALIAMRDDEDRLTEDELVYLCMGILIGGHETTANQIGLSLVTLCEHPAELARLRSDLSLLPGAVEELMRYVALGTGLPPARLTTAEVTFGEQAIPAGQLVFPMFGIANRDPAVFSDPDRFDISRGASTHLGFGIGAHHCLGAQLARIELAEAFRGLFSRLPGLRLAVPVSELRLKENMAITSLRELPVTWDV